MKPISLLALALAPAIMLAQLGPNSVSVSAGQTAVTQPAQAVFSIAVTSPATTQFSAVAAAVSGVGISSANLVGVNSFGSNTNQTTLTWSFQLTVPFSGEQALANSLASLAASIGQNNSGLSLTYSAQSSGAVPNAPAVCDFVSIFQSARAQAQQLANTAGLGLGGVLSVTNSATSCVLGVQFSLGTVSAAIVPSTVTVTEPQTITPSPDEYVIYVFVQSPLTASLTDVTSALSSLGITSLVFVRLSSFPTAAASGAAFTQYDLQWEFTLLVPVSRLNAEVAQFIAAEQKLMSQNTGLSLTFQVTGPTFSQTPSCSNASLYTAVQTRAQQIAAAAGLSLGQVMNISSAASGTVTNAFLASAAFGTTGTTGTTGVLGIGGVPSACELTARFQLYN